MKFEQVWKVVSALAKWACRATTTKGQLLRWWLVLSLYYSPIGLTKEISKSVTPARPVSTAQATPKAVEYRKQAFTPSELKYRTIDSLQKFYGNGMIDANNFTLNRETFEGMSDDEARGLYETVCRLSEQGRNQAAAIYPVRKAAELTIAQRGYAIDGKLEKTLETYASVLNGAVMEMKCFDLSAHD